MAEEEELDVDNLMGEDVREDGLLGDGVSLSGRDSNTPPVTEENERRSEEPGHYDNPRVALLAKDFLELALANPIPKQKSLPSAASISPESLVAPIQALVDANGGVVDVELVSTVISGLAAKQSHARSTRQRNRGATSNAKMMATSAIYNAKRDLDREERAEKRQRRAELETTIGDPIHDIEGPQNHSELALDNNSINEASTHEPRFITLESLAGSLQLSLKTTQGVATRQTIKTFLSAAKITSPKLGIGALVERLGFFLELSDQKVTKELVENLLQLAEPMKKKRERKQKGANQGNLDLFGMPRNSEAMGPAATVATRPVQDFQPAQSNVTLLDIQAPELANRSVGSVNSLESSTSPKSAPPRLETDANLKLAPGYFESASKATEESTATLQYPKPAAPDPSTPKVLLTIYSDGTWK